MKRSNKVGVWRPAGGAILVGALAFAVGAYAAPRSTDRAASPGKDGTAVRAEAAQLVTGSPAHLQSVVAGTGPTAILEMKPRPTAAIGSYPAGTTISGNDLVTDSDNFRIWIDYRVENWDPANDGTVPDHPGTAQIRVDPMGFLDADVNDPGTSVADDGDQPDLAYPVIACGANGPCIAAFGEAWAKCELGTCKGSYQDATGAHRDPTFGGVCSENPCSIPGTCTCTAGTANVGFPCNSNAECNSDSYCRDFGSGDCNQGDCDTSVPNHRCFGITEVPRPDGGISYYLASMVLDIPIGAKGKYTVGIDPSPTKLVAGDAALTELEVAIERGFTVTIRTGSCCFALGTPGAGCTDYLTKAECEGNPAILAPKIWTPNKLCSQGCVECVTNANCNDDDSCSTERCSSVAAGDAADGLCIRGCVAGWDQATECCDGSGATANITTISDGDACTADACSGGAAGSCTAPDPDNGTATNTPATGPCDDGNPCTFDDSCDGLNSEEDGGCAGTDINGEPCTTLADCPTGAQSCDPTTGCVCSLTPNLSFELSPSAAKVCAGGFNDGLGCASDEDCPGGGACDNFADGANCFDDRQKFTADVHIGVAAAPINGAQVLVVYDPTCLDYQSASCLAPYTTTVYGPTVDEASGSIFIACGINAFAGLDGPLGGVDVVQLNFRKIGECDECELCFSSNNPENTYLVDDEGQRVAVEAKCKSLRGRGELDLVVPPDLTGDDAVNADCDSPTGTVSWSLDGPSASFSCGDGAVTMTCRGAHETGLAYSTAVVMNGGTFPQGNSSFCCYVEVTDDDFCFDSAGCTGSGCGPTSEGCWTVEVTDETSMDIHIQLEPPITHDDPDGVLTRCIEFCMYGACTDDPVCFDENVDFGGMFNYVGKTNGKIKVPKGKWGCITAQDQLHTLRSCTDPDCINGQLIAEFKGDPEYGGNWLIGGNLDGWKKDVPGAQPSLDVIDILDYGTFVAEFGGPPYPDNDTPCGTPGPNADINGDGDVNMADYNFVLSNFLVSSKECCCGPQTGAILPANPITEISVEQLRQMGLGDLAVADLNGDGLVNATDMDAFMQGARPTKTGTGRGGKGLRSGR